MKRRWRRRRNRWGGRRSNLNNYQTNIWLWIIITN